MGTDLGQRIARARRQAGMSGLQLGRALKLTSTGVISQYETGAQVPRPARLKQIAEATGVDADWLATGQGQMHPPEGPAEAGATVLADDDLEEYLLSIRLGVDQLLDVHRPLDRDDAAREPDRIAGIEKQIAEIREQIEALADTVASSQGPDPHRDPGTDVAEAVDDASRDERRTLRRSG